MLSKRVNGYDHFPRALIIKLRQNMRFFCHFWLKEGSARQSAFGLLLREFFLFFWPDVIVLQRLTGERRKIKEQTGNKNNSSITNII
jgi:hypothetical protein